MLYGATPTLSAAWCCFKWTEQGKVVHAHAIAKERHQQGMFLLRGASM